MARKARLLLTAAALACAWAASVVLVGAGGSTTRPQTAGGGSARGGGAPSRATGHAGYAHGHGGGHYGHYGHYGYYGGYPYYDPFYYGLWWGPYGTWWVPPATWVLGASLPPDTPAVVETAVRPTKAEVWVDDSLVGQARDFNGRWDRLWIAPGKHSMEFRKNDYQTLRLSVDLAPGGFLRVTDELAAGSGLDPRSADPGSAGEVPPGPAPGEGTLRQALLRFEILPPDAAVYLDGGFLAQAGELSRLHGALPVAEGAHRIEVVRPGYETEVREVEALRETPVRVRIELRPEGGES